MLQSGQVDEGILIEALVTRYYQSIYHQALSMLKYPEEAHRAAQEVFTQAVLHTSTYRGDLPVSSWLEEILKTVSHAGDPQEVCQALLALALDRGGKDNVTVVLARYDIPAEHVGVPC